MSWYNFFFQFTRFFDWTEIGWNSVDAFDSVNSAKLVTSKLLNTEPPIFLNSSAKCLHTTAQSTIPVQGDQRAFRAWKNKKTCLQYFSNQFVFRFVQNSFYLAFWFNFANFFLVNEFRLRYIIFLCTFKKYIQSFNFGGVCCYYQFTDSLIRDFVFI